MSGVDRSLPAFTDFVKALGRPAARPGDSRPEAASPDHGDAGILADHQGVDNISRQLACTSGILTWGRDADEVRQGLATMRFKSKWHTSGRTA
jgi:hypothetical protein